MSQLRTNAILDAAGGNTATINTVPLRPGVLDPENRIINGAFDFWQRGTSFTTGVYGADRWINDLSGGTVTMSRQAFTVGDTLGSSNPTYFLRQTVSGQSGVNDRAIVSQPIEGVRSYAGQTITVLGWARRSSGSGNVTIEPLQFFGTGGSPSSDTLITPQTVTLTTSFAPFALTFSVPSIAGKTLGTNGNDSLVLNFWTSAGSNRNARSNSLGLQTIGVDLWGVHIKVGTHTTAATDLYKQPELGPELARCQRYYQLIASTAGVLAGRASGTTGAIYGVPLTVPMRGNPSANNPTMIFYGATAFGTSSGGTNTLVAYSTSGVSITASFVKTGFTGITDDRIVNIYPTQELTLDAEL